MFSLVVPQRLNSLESLLSVLQLQLSLQESSLVISLPRLNLRGSLLLELWKQVEVQSGESEADVRQAQESRLDRLEQLLELKQQATALEKKLAADPQTELELARLLGQQEVPVNVPPFDRLAQKLQAMREQREERQREAAKQRYAEVLKTTSADA